VRLPAEQRVRANKWRKFERIFSDGSRQVRYIREIIYGKKRELRYWEITADIETLPENSTWYVMTQIPGVLAKEVGNLGVGELRYDEAQTRSPTTKMIFLILSRNRNISKS